jgi:hypothetical protein
LNLFRFPEKKTKTKERDWEGKKEEGRGERRKKEGEKKGSRVPS